MMKPLSVINIFNNVNDIKQKVRAINIVVELIVYCGFMLYVACLTKTGLRVWVGCVCLVYE